MNRKVWLVLSREYKQHVMKKSFWIGILLGPAFFVGLFSVQFLLLKASPEEQKSLAIVDRSGSVMEHLQADLAADKLKSGKPEFILQAVPPAADTTAQAADLGRRVGSGDLFGYLMVEPNIDQPGAFRLYTKNVGNAMTIDKLEEGLNRALIGIRLERRQLDISREQLDEVTRGAHLETFKVSKEGEATKGSFGAVYFGTFIFVFILYITIFVYGNAALRGILEEKSSRIIEVLLASVTPRELMTGKILGLCLVGLTQVGTYAVTGTALSLTGAGFAGGRFSEFISVFTPAVMGAFVLFFLLGFFLFSAIFTAIGSVVNTEQEAQHMMQPVVYALVIPMAMTFFFVNSPDSMVARIASLIPLFTPMVMFMRIMVLTPPLWEIALSVVLTTATIVFLIRMVGRIFRVGILMYGKRPTLPEILRWARAS